MRFLRRDRPMTKSEAARAALLETLDQLAATDHRAEELAAAIRERPRDVDRAVAWAAGHIAESHGAWVQLDSLIRAIWRYELDAHDVDLVRAPSLDQRRRESAATVEERLRASLGRQQSAAARVAARQAERHLAATRTEQRSK